MDDRAGKNLYRRFALLLIPALAGGADQDLSAAALCMVYMPVVPAARLKSNVCQKYRALAGLG